MKRLTRNLMRMTCGLALLSAQAHAADTDIFLNPVTSGSTNLLIVIDNAGSINANTTDIDGTSKKIYEVSANVIKALLDPKSMKVKKTVFTSDAIVETGTNCTKTPSNVTGCACSNFGYVVDPDDASFCKLPGDRASKLESLVHSVSLGVMLSNGSASTGASGNADKGGYVAFHVQPMSAATTRQALSNKLGSIPTASGSMYSMTMLEAYRYFKNMQAYNGFKGNRTFATNSMVGYDRRSCGLTNGGASNCATNAIYTGPVTSNSCTNAIVVIGPGSPDNSALERDTGLLSGIGGNTTVIPTGGNPNYDANMFDEYARYFNSHDFNGATDGVQAVNTYTIMNDPSPATREINFLRSAATHGGGEYYHAKNAVDFIEAFVTVLTKVQSIDSAFASVALPVSVNVRGTNLNQVYIGMFRPDPDGKPRWYGNMKQYQLAYDSGTGDVYLAGKDGLRAETTSGQLLRDTAVSFWTENSTFWNFSPSGVPPSGNDRPDGTVVEKGGAAQMAREQFSDATKQGNRKLYTCVGCTNGTVLGANSETTFASTPAVNFGVADASNLISWCRGADLQNESPAQVRASLYGDVLHSRPAVINYNRNTTCATADDNDVFVFYGANDGFFKATKGGTDSAGGKEEWAFIPGEFVGKLNTLYQNDELAPKPYFVDGSVSSYVEYSNTACPNGKVIRQVSKAYLFLTMRRGGRLVYALDITDPSVPKMLWKLGNSTSGFSRLGDTWSEAKVANVKVGADAVPVLIFGGGYDVPVDDILNENIASSSGTSVVTTSAVTVTRTMGNAVYVVRISDGALLWRASSQPAATDCPATAVCTTVSGMDYSIPADLGSVDYSGDGYADRIYFGDTGANVWRANIHSTNRSEWTVTKIAQFNVARTGELASSTRRKFLYSPDVVRADGYAMVLIGSGDREQPFDKTVINRFYAIKDTGSGPATPIDDTDADLLELTSANWASGVTLASNHKGWFYTLTQSGEKVVSAPVTVNGVTFFNTNIPRSACGTGLGEARIYALNYLSGKAQVYTSNGQPSGFTTVAGGGYLPTGVPVVVKIDGKLREVLLVGSKISQDLGVVQLGRRVRTHWFQSIDQ